MSNKDKLRFREKSDSLLYKVFEKTKEVLRIKSVSLIASKVNSDVVTVGTTAVQLPSNSAVWIQLMHEHDTAIVYIGGSTVTINNGFGALRKEDTTERYLVNNTSAFYAISDTDSVSLRIMWGE